MNDWLVTTYCFSSNLVCTVHGWERPLWMWDLDLNREKSAKRVFQLLWKQEGPPNMPPASPDAIFLIAIIIGKGSLSIQSEKGLGYGTFFVQRYCRKKTKLVFTCFCVCPRALPQVTEDFEALWLQKWRFKCPFWESFMCRNVGKWPTFKDQDLASCQDSPTQNANSESHSSPAMQWLGRLDNITAA